MIPFWRERHLVPDRRELRTCGTSVPYERLTSLRPKRACGLLGAVGGLWPNVVMMVMARLPSVRVGAREEAD
eukprot:1352939-Pleurochrysis_carterae.AAC.2